LRPELAYYSTAASGIRRSPLQPAPLALPDRAISKRATGRSGDDGAAEEGYASVIIAAAAESMMILPKRIMVAIREVLPSPDKTLLTGISLSLALSVSLAM
jgi:hypothetical protein